MDKKDSEEGTGEMAYSSVLSVSTEIKEFVSKLKEEYIKENMSRN